jgi:SMI1 / KNR4 family (SUKH-1)
VPLTDTEEHHPAMTRYTNLVPRIAQRAREEGSALPAALDEAAIRRAEAELGFALHPLLSTVYREVSNGGFGPEYSLLSLIDGTTREKAVDLYTGQRSKWAGSAWAWPAGVLPILHWGCGMYASVDCRSEDGTVLLFEPNPGDPDLAWYVDSPSLAEWFEHYINDTGWWVKVEEGEEPDDMPPWPDAKARA